MKRRTWIPLASALVLGGASVSLLWPFTIDDAFIPCRYAANLAAGHGLVFNVGERFQGVTGLAWTLLLANGALFGIGNLPLLAKVLGALAALAVVALTALAASRSCGGRRGWLAVTVLLVTSLSFSAYAVAGLETALYTLLVTVAVVSALGVGPRAPRDAGLLLGLAAWVRPEALVPLVALAIARPRRAPRMLAFALPLLGLLALATTALFGRLLPETYFARLAPSGAGRAYVLNALLPTGLAPLLALGLLAVYHGGRRERTLAIVVLAQLLAIVVVGGDWMPGWRFLVPLWPLLSLLAVRGALRLRVRLRRNLAGRIGGPALLALATVLGALTFAVTLPDARASANDRRRGGEALVRALRGASSLALVDVGYVGWRTPAEVVDLGGLTDRRIARAPGVYLDKEVPEAYLRRRDPDAIVLHATERPVVESGRVVLLHGAYGVEERVASFPFVRDRYVATRVVRYADGYWYVVLRRRVRA